MEPMPDVPALPPNAPSFSERLSNDRSPSTPPQPAPRPVYQANSSRKVESRPPPPPLPLRLRPPLRKKKSFSRVSSWLGFQGGEQHNRDISLDSITNIPRPTTGNDGFYEVAQPTAEPSRRSSFESVSSSDWSADEEQTVPTSWSPDSDTTIKATAEAPTGMGLAFERGQQGTRLVRPPAFPRAQVPSQVPSRPLRSNRVERQGRSVGVAF